MKIRDPSDLKDDRAIRDSLKRLPSSLYKYSGVGEQRLEWLRRLVVDSELYFERPGNFNDPLDCRIPPSFEATRDVVERHWKRVAKEQAEPQDRRTRRQAIKGLIRNSETQAGRRDMEESVFKSVNRNGIVCLSKDPTNMLMWSYYAEGHHGVALRIDTSLERLAAFKGQIIPIEVDYKNTLPEINFYHSTIKEFVTAVLGTKAKAWEHEKEWRLISVGNKGYLRAPSGLVNGIIFGIRTKADVETRIRSWAERRTSKIEFFRARHRHGSFELEIIPA